MSITNVLDEIHLKVIRNIWLQRFTLFNRVVLAAAFIPSGLKKVMGERFTQMSMDTPVGLFFEAMYQSGFYYNFIGWAQVIAAILLLIPRTSTLGAVIFFPIVLNICLITISVGFQGTWVITTAMVLANLYLLCWDYDKLKFILPFEHSVTQNIEAPTAFKMPLWERACWASFGALIVAFLLMVNSIGRVDLVVIVIAAIVVGGVGFAILAGRHRRNLSTYAEKVAT